MNLLTTILFLLILNTCSYAVQGHTPSAYYDPANLETVSKQSEQFNKTKTRTASRAYIVDCASFVAGGIIFSSVSWLLFSSKSNKIWALLPFKIHKKYQQWKKPYVSKNWFKGIEFVGKSICIGVSTAFSYFFIKKALVKISS